MKKQLNKYKAVYFGLQILRSLVRLGGIYESLSNTRLGKSPTLYKLTLKQKREIEPLSHSLYTNYDDDREHISLMIVLFLQN